MFTHQNAKITRLFAKFCQVEFQRAKKYAFAPKRTMMQETAI